MPSQNTRDLRHLLEHLRILSEAVHPTQRGGAYAKHLDRMREDTRAALKESIEMDEEKSRARCGW